MFDDPVAQAKKVQTFRYKRPGGDAPKAIMKLAQTDLVKGAVKIVGPGGRNNLHSHAGSDTFWVVLKGRARFYSGIDGVISESRPFEGIVTPRNTPY
ncbi:MAG: cupin domain-containing protein [Alphaproteobacteria bacterium]